MENNTIIANNLVHRMHLLQEQTRVDLIKKGCTKITRLYKSYLPDENTFLKIGIGYTDKNQKYHEEEFKISAETKLKVVFGERGKIKRAHKLGDAIEPPFIGENNQSN